MTKYTNPFHTIWETIAVLQDKEAHPLSDLPESQVDWREHILSIIVSRNYESTEHHFGVDIHLDFEGFEALYSLIGGDISIVPHSAEYDKVFFEPSPLLHLNALMRKEVTK